MEEYTKFKIPSQKDIVVDCQMLEILQKKHWPELEKQLPKLEDTSKILENGLEIPGRTKSINYGSKYAIILYYLITHKIPIPVEFNKYMMYVNLLLHYIVNKDTTELTKHSDEWMPKFKTWIGDKNNIILSMTDDLTKKEESVEGPGEEPGTGEGGSKSRRRHRRKPVRKTRRGHTRKSKSKSKSKPKTHRRRRHSRVRKHKKYTSRRR